MKKLKERWGITSNFQVLIIFVVFGITGSTSAKLAGPIVELLGITAESVSLWLYWPLRILIIFPLYQVLLILFGFIFGQFAFFWNFEKKMLSRLGFKKFLD
ncbi:MAG: diacylglyceryl transferase [Flavobacteriaceae bacterium]|nr:diacylglyceryl transferase [Flavobacteriaceae bacterium]MDG2315066.1 diacylglyceryl transferase [Flavobacteriaceae bacterium]